MSWRASTAALTPSFHRLQWQHGGTAALEAAWLIFISPPGSRPRRSCWWTRRRSSPCWTAPPPGSGCWGPAPTNQMRNFTAFSPVLSIEFPWHSCVAIIRAVDYCSTARAVSSSNLINCDDVANPVVPVGLPPQDLHLAIIGTTRISESERLSNGLHQTFKLTKLLVN